MFDMYVYFLWKSVSGWQGKTSANNSTVLKETGNNICFWTLFYPSVALGLTAICSAFSDACYSTQSYQTVHSFFSDSVWISIIWPLNSKVWMNCKTINKNYDKYIV